ncbi:DUF4878 domain-containing protein [Dokdonella fugitiva]|jgi:hypothetical protein|uniref:Uncharacterized protein DUF4878 n=1 Tax=Dokdonella fugitiva TaxID=328517 RepID=A0A4R2I5E5_9GAMM|nr:DUF4878 domain-containing protein [Dokdonella fugitiva]TCO38358.1 uncharacterized protein DUF4878 [Dokdonella fugitiva]
MNSILRLLPAGLAFATGLALADGSGTLYEGGKPIALKHAYAYRMPDPFDKDKQITRIVFADKPIDDAALAGASDRDGAIDDQLREATRVDLNLEPDGSVQNVNTRIGYSSGSQSGSGWYTLSLKRNDDQRVEGSFRSNDEEDKNIGRYYDLVFALDLPGAPDPGAVLPADGGEPGKAYLAHLASLRKGDIDALAKSMTKARADELLAHRNDAEFKMMFGFIQGQALREPKYVKGNARGDRATLEYTGKDADGNAVTNTVSMLREGGAWKVEKESSKTTLQ